MSEKDNHSMHKTRNITPGTGEIQTFMDCPYRWWEQEQSIVHGLPLYSCQMWYLDMGCVYICEKLVARDKCPRGYANPESYYGRGK